MIWWTTARHDNKLCYRSTRHAIIGVILQICTHITTTYHH